MIRFDDETLQNEYEKLTEKQKRWIDYYIETGNSSLACVKAGYKEKNSHVLGSQNLVKLNKFIKPLLESKQSERIASQDEVLEYLTRVMRGEEKDAFNLDASLQDRTKCAELLGKRWGTFTERREITGAVPVIISGDDNLAE